MNYTQKEAKTMHTALMSIPDTALDCKHEYPHLKACWCCLVKDALPEPETPVIFRVFKEGDVIALFPTLPGTNDPTTCQSYQHIGQHGAASIDLGKTNRLATRKEYMPLKKELEQIGYRLKVVAKIAPAHHETRRAELARVS